MPLVEISGDYCGYKKVLDNDPLLDKVYLHENPYGLLENEYLAVFSAESGKPIDRLKYQDGRYKTV